MHELHATGAQATCNERILDRVVADPTEAALWGFFLSGRLLLLLLFLFLWLFRFRRDDFRWVLGTLLRSVNFFIVVVHALVESFVSS